VSGKPGRPRWSWYRLAEPFAATLVRSSGVRGGDLVLDLGAGDGAITRHLVTSGARTIAFELHPARARHLRRSFAADDVVVVRADVRDLRLPTRPFRVVANPPFDGVSAVLVRLTSRGSRMTRADLIVPRSVATAWHRRLLRRSSDWHVIGTEPLPRSAFTPRPRIDCCVMVIERRRPGRSGRP
jgi:23S rRNA (adenine-N6)-dimethyltransferase